VRPEVVETVRSFAKEHRTRFRASFVADKAGVSLEEARRDLVRLASAGVVLMNFELLCPDDDATVATFREREEIPVTFSTDECGDGEEFEVTPELIWVTFTPTDEYRAEVAREESASRAPTAALAEEGAPPGKSQSQRAARNKTRSRSTSHRPMLH
jgi:hypothetical protein